MRVIAACMVIITHSYILKGGTIKEDILYGPTNGDLLISTLGLRTFFIISGYLITQSMERSRTYISYLVKRVLRIFPGLLCCLILSVCIFGPIFSNLSLSAYFHQAATWHYFINISLYKIQLPIPSVLNTNPSPNINGSIWTLCYEFSFYIMIMCLCFAKIFKHKWSAFVVFSIFLALQLYTVYFKVPPKLYYFLIHTDLQLDYFTDFGLYFLAGTLLYLYKDRIRYTHSIAILMLCLYILGVVIHMPWLTKYIAIPYIIMYLGYVPKFGLITNWGKKADLSYGIYIYGMPVQQAIIATIGSNLSAGIVSLLSIIVVLPIAWLSWNIIEKRALKLKMSI